MKRAVDLTVTIALLPIAVVLISCSAVAIWLIDRGPIFLRQEREGKDGCIFHMLKLRTMYRNADEIFRHALQNDEALRDEWDRYLRLENDPRHIRYVGKLLRHTSLDELPQIFNVLKGEMSLVGPRPFAVDLVSALDPAFRQVRSSVPPGMTGLWQVSGRSDLETWEMERFDREYLEKRSAFYDLTILARTIPAVLMGRGAY